MDEIKITKEFACKIVEALNYGVSIIEDQENEIVDLMLECAMELDEMIGDYNE